MGLRCEGLRGSDRFDYKRVIETVSATTAKKVFHWRSIWVPTSWFSYSWDTTQDPSSVQNFTLLSIWGSCLWSTHLAAVHVLRWAWQEAIRKEVILIATFRLCAICIPTSRNIWRPFQRRHVQSMVMCSLFPFLKMAPRRVCCLIFVILHGGFCLPPELLSPI